MTNRISKEEAARATRRLSRDLHGIESRKQDAPELDRVKTLGKKYGNKTENIIREERKAVVFGRATEIGQMPYDRDRGYTKDVDILVKDEKKFARKTAKRLGKKFRVDKEKPNVVERASDGEDVIDAHTFPENYRASGKHIIRKNGISQEKLYVQAQRKASATLGNDPKDYGPREHRLKDPYDLVRYSYYLAQQKNIDTKRRNRIIRNANIIKTYFSYPSNYDDYQHGREFGPRFKTLQPSRQHIRVCKPSIHVKNNYSGIFSMERLKRILF